MVVLSVKPFSGYYPACYRCKSKLRGAMNSEETENDSRCCWYWCSKCSIRHAESSVVPTYCVALEVSDGRLSANVVAFGCSVDRVMMVSAMTLHKYLAENCFSMTGKHQMDFSDVSLILRQPLEAIFAGQYFKFTFPSPKFKTVSKTPLSLSELLQDGSSKGQCLIASAVDPVFPVSCSVLSLVRQHLIAATSATPRKDIGKSFDTPVRSLLQSPSSLCSSTIVSENAPAVRLVPPQDSAFSSPKYNSFSNVVEDGFRLKDFSLSEFTVIPSASAETIDVSSNDGEGFAPLSQPSLFCTPVPAMNSSNTEIPGSHDASFWREFYHNSQSNDESCQNRSSDSIAPVEATTLSARHQFWDASSQLEIEIISEMESDWLNTQSVKQKLFSSPDFNTGSSYPVDSDTGTGLIAELHQTMKQPVTLLPAYNRQRPSSPDSSFCSTLTTTANSSLLDLFNELTPVQSGMYGNCLPKSKKPRLMKENCTPVPCSGRWETGMSSGPVAGTKSAHCCTSGQLKGLALFGKLTPLSSTQQSTPQQQTGSSDPCFTPDLI